MTQNMFQEGLYQVFVRETQSERPPPEASDEGDLRDARIRRWFGTVVGSRVCVTGATQAVSALACILSTVTYSCVSFNCSMSMTMPVWSSVFVRLFITRRGVVQREDPYCPLVTDQIMHRFSKTRINKHVSLFQYLGTGALALLLPKKPTKMRVAALMVLNLFSFLLGFSALLSFAVNSVHAVALKTNHQRIGSRVAEGSAITFTGLCLLASLYTLFLTWRGLRRYSAPNSQTYGPVPQHLDEGTSPLLEQAELGL